MLTLDLYKSFLMSALCKASQRSWSKGCRFVPESGETLDAYIPSVHVGQTKKLYHNKNQLVGYAGHKLIDILVLHKIT